MSDALLRDFTEAVVRDEYRKNGAVSGYRTEEGNQYDSYMDNDSWNAMLAAMRDDHRCQYADGGGGELREKNGRPPKMASFISSSRMIYQLSKDIPGFVFEAKRPTVVGGIANLDGYLSNDSKTCYVEAKLREPYSHSAIQKIKVNYQPVYIWLRERMNGYFNCVMEHCSEREMNVVFSCRNNVFAEFDIKQMICHLLGIAAYHLRQEQIPESIRFLYLLYNPSKLSIEEHSAAQIMRIHQNTVQAAEGYHFERMFGHIIDFLIETHDFPADHAPALKKAFSFRLCDQDTYHSCFP